MTAKPRGILLAGNWKMNKGPREAEAFFQELNTLAGKELNTEQLARTRGPSVKGNTLQCLTFVPAVSLAAARSAGAALAIPTQIGAQNAHSEKSGAFTGELSGPMLSELGLSWVLIGHSERRTLFGESNESAGRRTRALLAQGFKVMLCIGETREQRESNQTAVVLTAQLEAALTDECREYLDGRLVLAYEPVWAIGTGLTATPEQAESTHQLIRKWLWDRHGMDASGRTSILYGGSVTPANCATLLACPNIDGALVGGASLKPDSWLALVKAALA